MDMFKLQFKSKKGGPTTKKEYVTTLSKALWVSRMTKPVQQIVGTQL